MLIVICTEPKLTAACKQCKHASATLKWCGLFGVSLDPVLVYPPKMEQAKGFIKTAGKVIRGGFKIRSQQAQAKIKDICIICEYRDPANGRCSQCGCGLDRAIKFADKHCPNGKW